MSRRPGPPGGPGALPVLQRVPAPAGTRWHRAWPGARSGAAAGEPVGDRAGEPQRVLVLEGRDAAGRAVAATARVHLDGGVLTGADVEVLERDERLPALAAALAQGGTLLAHRAGKRAVLRTGPARAPRAFLKVARPAATRTALARLRSVDAALGGHPHRPGLVEVRGTGEGLLRLEPVAGTDLAALLAAGAGAAARCRAAGRATALATGALADASASPAALALPGHDAAAEAALLRRWVEDARGFGVLPPPLAARALALAGALGDALHALPAAAPVLSHRDLHDGQVLVRSPPRGAGAHPAGGAAGGAAVTFLDVDTAARADPCLDAANLLAHLDLALARGAAPSAVAALSAGLREGWRACGHPLLELGPRRLELWRAAARLRLVAVHAFRGPVHDLAPWLEPRARHRAPHGAPRRSPGPVVGG
ncbi:hypothetical protein [Kineococcus sp. SYSU DK005]|uniref:hypothetical protein n=1 Tax=Kineococcus sp. SYSU DK005 TaxID=3383126 RepID=UPI003D7D4E30